MTFASSSAPVTDKADPLGGIRLLETLPAERRRRLAQQCCWRRYAAGEHVIDREDDNRDMLCIVEGRVRVVDPSVNGRQVVLAEIAAGGHVGELAAIDGRPRSADVVAASACLIAALPSATFRRLLLEEPRFCHALLEEMAQVIRLADLRITELCTMGAVERLCRELLRLGGPSGKDDGLEIDPVPTQEAFAAVIGTTRENVGRILAQLAHAGVIRRKGRTLQLLRPDELGQLARLGSQRGSPDQPRTNQPRTNGKPWPHPGRAESPRREL